VLYRACWRVRGGGGPVAPIRSAPPRSAPCSTVLDPKVVLASPGLPLASLDDVVPVRGDGRCRGAWRRSKRCSPDRASGPRPKPSVRPCAVIFTSGSTGSPEGRAAHPPGLAYKALTMTRVHGLSGGDAVLMPAPLAHISGLCSTPYSSPGRRHEGGADGALGRRCGSADDRGRADQLHDRPTLDVLRHPRGPGFSPERVSSLRVVSSGMMGVSPEFIEAARIGLGAVVNAATVRPRRRPSRRAPTTTPRALPGHRRARLGQRGDPHHRPVTGRQRRAGPGG